MTWLLPLFATEIPFPTDGDNAWIWVAGVSVFGGGYLVKRVLDDKDRQIERLQGELDKTSVSLEKMTDVVERQRQTVVEGFAAQRQTIIEGFERVMDSIAPRRRDGS